MDQAEIDFWKSQGRIESQLDQLDKAIADLTERIAA